MRHLPNLNAVRAFDAAARHGSFAAAAAELGVSHAAVSRHVRNLERELGVELFERHARHVVLTGEGGFFAKTVAESLSSLELGSGRVRRRGGRTTVVIDIESDLAMRWLMPLMSDAVLAALGVHLDLRVRPDPPRHILPDADITLSWGPVTAMGFKTSPFLDFTVFPVAAPALLANGPEPSGPIDPSGPVDPAFFRTHRMIHERGIYWWQRYCAAIGMRLEEAGGHLYVNRSYLSIDAAVRGLGVAMGDNAICRADLAAGRLVRVPGPTLSSREKYYLVVPERVLSRPVQRVIDWLTAEAVAVPLAPLPGAADA
ncbi:MAG: LysR family transcriptional regulator [Alphaproteobacteria bacterium]|nr:LysR family transcriptional regulator [Alphaproteobacteria bacterium]